MTGFPSATHLCLTLGADSPCADERCAGNLGLSASGPFTRFIATHVSIRTSDTSSMPLGTPSQAYGTLLYHRRKSFKHTFASRARPTLTVYVRARFATGTTHSRRAALAKRGGGCNVLEGFAAIRSFGYWLEPRYIFRAGRLDQ